MKNKEVVVRFIGFIIEFYFCRKKAGENYFFTCFAVASNAS